MKAILLRIHVPEGQRHQGMLLWEWLLQRGSELGARGGAAFRPIAGFGRHHVLREQKFFELAGSLNVQIELQMSNEQMQHLLEQVRSTGIRLSYSTVEISLGVVNPDAQDAAPPVP